MRLHAAPPLRFRLSKAAAAAGVAGATRFLEGDVTRLADDDLGDPFELVYDLQCLHGLPVTQRAAYAEGVGRLTRPGGSYALFALKPSSLRLLLGMPGGIAKTDVQTLFADRAGCAGQDRPAGPDRRGPGHQAGRRLGPARPSRQ
jgi:Thiopurine S-methyltransferase (TPMT)